MKHLLIFTVILFITACTEEKSDYVKQLENSLNNSKNVEDSINDENSILNYYKKLIKLRRENDVIKYGTFELILDNHKEVFAYIRKYKNIELLVICNFYSNNIEIELPNEYSEYSYETLLTNYTDSAKFSNVISLRPYETIVYKFKK